MAKKQSKTKKILSSVGKELKKNPPRILAKTAKKKGAAAAEKQRKAILLSKARSKGAKVPAKKGKAKKFNAGAYEAKRKKVFGLTKNK